MRIAERILVRCSRDPGRADLVEGVSDWSDDDPWKNLSVFPDIVSRIRGRDILDFGCGEGAQAIACLNAGARSVVGVDTNVLPLVTARRSAATHPMGSRARFVECAGCEPNQFDVIISQDAMEHFDNPDAVLNLWRRVLRLDGKVYVTFGPPWYAPYGAHMHFFTKVPWVHLLFPEQTVMRVRARYRNDGALRYEQVPGGLGRLSVAKFEALIKGSGFRVEWIRRDTIKGIPGASVPIVRELITNNIAAILAPE